MEEPTVNPGWRKSSYSDNGGSDCVEVGAWRKSSYSDNGGAACIEVGSPATSSAVTGVLVRDTTDRAGAVLAVPAAAWRALVAEVRG
jgi:uncharacterized protein DUF397